MHQLAYLSGCCGTDTPHVHLCYLPVMGPFGLIGWLIGPDGRAAVHNILRTIMLLSRP